MTFGKAFFASCLGAMAAICVLIFFSILTIGGMIAGLSDKKEVAVADNSVLHLKLDAQITELQADNPFEGLPFPGNDDQKVGLLQLKQAIAHAKDDDKIQGIYLESGNPMTGFSTLEEIRESLMDFRESGKWVYAYNEVMSEDAYYLASAADKIYLNPQGEVEFNGLTVNIGFYKKMFDKLQIKPQIFRVGEFKSAVEPFILEKMSAENRLQHVSLANSIYDHVLTRIAESRNIERQRLEEISDKMLVRDAQQSVELGLIDSLLYRDQFIQLMKDKLDVDDDKDIKFIKYNKYRKSYSSPLDSKNEIAVIVADGTIMPGEGSQSDQVIGADTFVEEIRKARRDDDIKAIVLRVNSPGGEFRASDMMWREIELAKEAKPVIASMSDYAASGGYYMAMGCDTIVAQPHTITGSIGIFGMMFDMSDFLDEKLGITFDEVRTGEFGNTYTVTRPLTEAEKNFIQRSLDQHYNTFTTKAAEGRDLPHADIQKVASGRVWTGVQALDNKLIDVLGGFDDAVRIAAEKAGIEDDYDIRFYPKQKSFLEEFLESNMENAKTNALKAELGDLYRYYDDVQKLKTLQGAQARMPFELQFE
jgi:protease-4